MNVHSESQLYLIYLTKKFYLLIIKYINLIFIWFASKNYQQFI